ncbi:MAG: hypothetical protein ACFFAN_06725 [Promethearchaeota archaeon]
MKGQDVLDSFIYKDVKGEFPNQNYIVGWVLRTLVLPNINPHQVMKTVQALIKQAVQRKQQPKVVAPVAETKKVQLEKVPQSEIKRAQAKGWVKEEGEKTRLDIEEEKRKAFRERVEAKKIEQQTPTTSTLKTTRKLPSIPGTSPKKVDPTRPASIEKGKNSEFCPYCGGNLNFKFCPFCGKPLPTS